MKAATALSQVVTYLIRVTGTIARPPAPVHAPKPCVSGGFFTALALSFLGLYLRSQAFVSLTGMLSHSEPRIALCPLQGMLLPHISTWLPPHLIQDSAEMPSG